MASIISAGTTSGTSLNLSADTSGVLQLATNGTTTAVTIDTSQNVGIGVSSPAAKLHVSGTYGTTATGGVRLVGIGQTTGDLSPIAFYLQSSNWGTAHQATITAQQVSGTDGGSNLLFGTSASGGSAPSERMRITSTGNLGLGVTPSASDLPTMQSNYALVSGNLQTNIISNGYYTSALGFTYTSTAVATHYRQVSGAHQFFCAPSGTINTAISFTQVLNAEKDKSIALQGGASQTGTGITFPSTQNASSDATTLDDYEEGTWTGTLTAATPPTTAVTATGTYTKIGRQVTLNIQFSNVNTTGASGTMQITGIPFTPSADAMGTSGKVGLGATYDIAYMANGNNSVRLVTQIDLSYVAIVAGTGKYLWVTVTYFV